MLNEEYFGVSLNTNGHLESVECYYCHKKEHYKNECPEKLKAYEDKTQKVTGQQHAQISVKREGESGTELVSWYDGNGYFANFCMTQLSHTFEEPETGNVKYGHILKQSKGSAVSKDWILLESQSTVDVFYNAPLLQNTRKVNQTLDIH